MVTLPPISDNEAEALYRALSRAKTTYLEERELFTRMDYVTAAELVEELNEQLALLDQLMNTVDMGART